MKLVEEKERKKEREKRNETTKSKGKSGGREGSNAIRNELVPMVLEDQRVVLCFLSGEGGSE